MARLSDQNLMDKWAGDVLPPRFVLWLFFAFLTAFKIVYFGLMIPAADEAYYWLWAQHPALSYYDHPPLLAWLQGGIISMFGKSLYATRLVTLICMAASSSLIWFWCKRLVPKKSLDTFLAALVFIMLTPMIMRFQSIAIQDCLLIVMAMASCHFLALFVESDRAGASKWMLYFAACVFIGLAGLSKYNGVFLAVGVALAAFITPLGRRWFMHWQFWAGGLLVLVMQSPVIIWNMQHDWPSFRYNLEDRIGQSVSGGAAGNFGFFAVNSLVMLGPVFVLALVRFVLPSGASVLGDFRHIARWVVIASTLTFALLCASNTILPYWNMAAYGAVLPVLVFFVRSRLEFYLHVLFCLVIGLWLMIKYGLYPIDKMLGNEPVRDVDISYGLDQLAAAVEAEEARLDTDFVVTTDYRTASLLSLETGRTDIEKMGARKDQFDFWFDQAAFKGKNALILADDYLPVDEALKSVFAKLTFVRTVETYAFGYKMNSYQLYYGEAYSGAGSY